MEFLWNGLLSITWQQAVMYAVGLLLIYLAIEKDYEPALLLPMGFGAILVNIPFSGALNQMMEGVGETHGIVQWLFETGIEASEAFPLLLFIGIGAMIDFGPLLSNPKMFLFGAAAQFGIFFTIVVAAFLGFDIRDAASIGIIGAADGPTSILVSQVLKSNYIGPIAVAAYSYMALVPIIQPMAVKAVTTKKERMIKMPYQPGKVSRLTRIAFPIIVTFIAGLVAPASVSLVGFLMFGNLTVNAALETAFPRTASIPGQPDHPSSGYYDLLLHACRAVRNGPDPDDHGARSVRLRFRYRRRRIICKVLKPVLQEQDQPHDRRCRDLRIPHVRPCH